MNKITKLWTGGVAYVSLLVGSGVSIAGNVADTFRTRPGAVDAVDIVLAVFAPLAVLLVIEMFVSTLWPRTFGPQAIRWVSTVLFGAVAAYVSWHHLSDLLLSRGQDAFLSAVEPLGIDGLAIMATALVLSSRRARGQDRSVDKPVDIAKLIEDSSIGQAEDTWRTEVTQDIPRMDIPLDQVEWTPPADVRPLGVDILGVDIPDALPSWMDGLADRTSGGSSVQAAPLPQRPPVVPGREGARRLTAGQRAEIVQVMGLVRAAEIAGRDGEFYSIKDAWLALSDQHGVSVKTIQRAEVSQ